MAFNLSYADKGADLSGAGDSFVASAKKAKAKAKEEPKKDEPKDKTETPPAAVADTTSKPSASKLIDIITKKGGSPTQSINPADKPVTLKDAAPTNPLTATDSLNVNLGLVHKYQQDLGKQIMSRNMQDSMAEMDKEAEDPNYLSVSRKNGAALELMDALMEAKKNGYGMDKLQLSPMADALHKGFINKAANNMISSNTYQPYLSAGAGLSKK